MNNADHRLPWSPEEHPPVEVLRAYQAGALAPSAEHQLEHHLLSCNLCADVAEGLALSSPAQTQAAVQDIYARMATRLAKEKKKVLVWADWRAAAAILVLLCSLALVIYQQYSQQIKPNPTIAATQGNNSLKREPAENAPNQSVLPTPLEAEIKVNKGNFKPSAPPVVYQRKLRGQPEEVVLPEIIEETENWVLKKEQNTKEMSLAPVPARSADVLLDSVALSDALAAQSISERNAPAPESSALRLTGKKPISVSSALAGSVAGVAVTQDRRLVKGKVVSSTGEALPGVTVHLKGTTQAAATDAEGNFTLEIPRDKSLLVASFIGFESREVVLAKNTQKLEIKLQEDNSSLSEVVVVGYGTSSKSSVQAPDVKRPAKPTIGMAAYKKHLQQNIKHPETSQEKKRKGRVVVQFTVSTSGHVQDLAVIKSLSPAHDAEALRLIKEGPAWKPGTRNGQPEAQSVKVTVRFKK